MDILQNLTNLLSQGAGGSGQQAGMGGGLGGLGDMLGGLLGGGQQEASAPRQQQYQQPGAASAGGGLGSLLDPGMLTGLLGSLMGAKGGATRGAQTGGAAGGMDLGGLLGALMGGGGGSLLGSLFGGGDQPPPAPQATAPADTLPQKRGENLLRALIYAAKADGKIDKQEEAAINDHVRKLGLGADAQNLVNQYLSEPVDPRNIARNITESNEALQIFALSAALTQVDQPAEQQYIESLGNTLGIAQATQQSIIKRIYG